MSDTKERYLIVGTGCFVWLWSVARACLQSITLDEADGYLNFGAPLNWPNYWFASSGNHVLHSMLQRLITSVIGMSQFTVRIPALIGGALYIAACYLLCRRLLRTPALSVLTFVFLVLNPFVLDYLTAARGYSLALGFLLLAIWALVDSRYALASLFAGLSLSANFSFAYIAICLLAVFGIHVFLRTRNWQTLASCVWPGATVVFVLCGQTLMRFPKSQIYYGAPHLKDMWQSIVSALFDDLNPYLAHDLIIYLGERVRYALPLLLAAMAVWQIVRIVVTGHKFAVDLTRAIVLAFFWHWIAFRIGHLPLPAARTAIFFVPIVVLLIAIGIEIPGTILPRRIQVLVLSVCCIYFAFCLRLNYFNEWKFDADTKSGFAIVRDLSHRGIGPFYTNWRYSSAFKFYRECAHDYTLPFFEEREEDRPRARVYTVHWKEEASWIEQQKLRVIYHDELSEMVIAVRDVN